MSAQLELAKRLAGSHGQRIAFSIQQIERIARNIAQRYGLNPATLIASLPPPTRRASAEMVLRGSSDGRVFTFICSTGETDRMNDTIAPSGWQLSAFKKNPVVLFAHDSASLPVGKAVSVGVQDGKLMASVKFASTGLGLGVADLIGGGFLRAVSVGFAPIDFEFAKNAARKGGIDFKAQELLEISIVPIPANSSCLLTGITGSDGKSISAKEERKRVLAEMRQPNTALKRKRARALELLKVSAPLPYSGPASRMTRADRARVLAEIRRGPR